MNGSGRSDALPELAGCDKTNKTTHAVAGAADLPWLHIFAFAQKLQESANIPSYAVAFEHLAVIIHDPVLFRIEVFYGAGAIKEIGQENVIAICSHPLSHLSQRWTNSQAVLPEEDGGPWA